MRKLFVPILIVFLIIGCDQNQQMMKPVLTPEVTAEPPLPEPPPPPAEEVIPEITHSNALELRLGETYRMRPSSYDELDDGFGNSTIWYIYWGNVDNRGRLHKGVSTDDPKTRLTFHLKVIDKNPYSHTLDGKPVIDWIDQDDGTIIYDEIVIRVTERVFKNETEKTGGPRGNRFTYAVAQYWAEPIKNLTHPDRTFEYE